jgi:hypothetical protein
MEEKSNAASNAILSSEDFEEHKEIVKPDDTVTDLKKSRSVIDAVMRLEGFPTRNDQEDETAKEVQEDSPQPPTVEKSDQTKQQEPVSKEPYWIRSMTH